MENFAKIQIPNFGDIMDEISKAQGIVDESHQSMISNIKESVLSPLLLMEDFISDLRILKDRLESARLKYASSMNELKKKEKTGNLGNSEKENERCKQEYEQLKTQFLEGIENLKGKMENGVTELFKLYTLIQMKYFQQGFETWQKLAEKTVPRNRSMSNPNHPSSSSIPPATQNSNTTTSTTTTTTTTTLPTPIPTKTSAKTVTPSSSPTNARWSKSPNSKLKPDQKIAEIDIQPYPKLSSSRRITSITFPSYTSIVRANEGNPNSNFKERPMRKSTWVDSYPTPTSPDRNFEKQKKAEKTDDLQDAKKSETPANTTFTSPSKTEVPTPTMIETETYKTTLDSPLASSDHTTICTTETTSFIDENYEQSEAYGMPVNLDLIQNYNFDWVGGELD